MIRKDLQAGENYGMYLSIAMKEYVGKEATVTHAYTRPTGEYVCYLDIDNGRFVWSNEMLEPKVENNFEKAKSKHEELLKERWEKDRKMELQQIEENLKGISELVNKLYEEVEKMKNKPQGMEAPKKYQLNVYVAKPMTGENVWWLNECGEIYHGSWVNGSVVNGGFYDNLYKYTNLFKDKESAETYRELLNDMKRLSKKFENNDYCIGYNYSWGRVEVCYKTGSYQRDYYFTRENVDYILNKYGQEVLRNFIRYCK